MIELSSEQMAVIQRGHALGFITHDDVTIVTRWNAQVRTWRNLPPPPPPELPIKELRIQRRVIELRIKDFSSGSEWSRKQFHSLEWSTRPLHLLQQAERDLARMDARIAIALDEIANPTPPLKLPEPPPPLPDRIRSVLNLVPQIALAERRLATELANTSQSTEKGLNAEDVELCQHWANMAAQKNPSTAVYSLDTLVNSQGSYRARQLLSARTAEHIATAYYRQLGYLVKDVSVSQNQGGNEDWKTFDLRVGTRAVDVKNARQSFNGNGNYVEHCVPQFKQERSYSEIVNILGIVSEYVVDYKKYLGPGLEALILGEVNAVEIQKLCGWALDRFGSALDLQAIWRPHFIPGWLLEYPPEHYSHRFEEIATIPSTIASCVDAQIPADAIPGWLLILCPDQALIEQLPITPNLRKTVQELRSMNLSIGLTRRSLMVYAMGITLESVVNFVDPSEKLTQFRDLIASRIDSRGFRQILGLHDPLEYVTSMIENLARIGSELIDRRFEITGFKLTNTAILLGIAADGSSLTLLAYCGGWVKVSVRTRCGTTSLVFGPNEHCKSCGRLVCKNCGHCSTGCVQCDDRQNKVAQSHLQPASHQNAYQRAELSARSKRTRYNVDLDNNFDDF